MPDISGQLPAFSAALTEHLQQPVPELLYHYTGQEGLLGIISSASLWATNINYMNDATEFRRPLSMLRDKLAEKAEHFEEEAKHFVELPQASRSIHVSNLARNLQHIEFILNEVERVSFCVACFCEDSDLLSQWRGYAGHGYGYSIGLNVKELRYLSAASGFILGRCIYENLLQETIIDELVDFIVSLSASDDKHFHIMEIFNLLPCIAFFKDQSFSQEREWRLVSAHLILPERTQFRPGKSMIIPYARIGIVMAKPPLSDQFVSDPARTRSFQKHLFLDFWKTKRSKLMFVIRLFRFEIGDFTLLQRIAQIVGISYSPL